MVLTATTIALAALLAGQAKLPNPLPEPPPATYSYGVDGRSAVVTPNTQGEARADGGLIEVLTPSPNVLSVSMTGTTAAFLCAGKNSTAAETFEASQEFEITCSDPSVKTVDLVLDSTLAGFVRSKHKAGAAVRFAELSVAPCIPGAPPIGLAHPPISVSGGDARLINQHLPRIRGCALPIGRFRLYARFRIDSEAGGFVDGHAVADFSPTTALPDTWVRARDPFQGVDKKNFGFVTLVTAEATTGSPPNTTFRIQPVDARPALASYTKSSTSAKRPTTTSSRPMPGNVSITNPPTRR